MVNSNKVVWVMETSRKKSIIVILWLVLLAYGVTGVLSALLNDNDYLKQNYYKTSQFQNEVNQLTRYIHAFDISYQPKEEVKRTLTVTKAEIEEYRFNNYGDLSQQIIMIEDQYRGSIERAESNKDEKVAAIYRNERDKRLEELTNIFENDELIKEKIVKEKEAEIDRYYEEVESQRQDYLAYDEAFAYYLKNTATGEIFTNLPINSGETVNQYINEQNTFYILNYPSKMHGYLRMNTEPLAYYEVVNATQTHTSERYEGKIGVLKNSPNTNMILFAQQNYNHERLIFWIYTIAAIVALMASIILGRRLEIIQKLENQKWLASYEKIPFDIAIVLWGASILTFMALTDGFSYLYHNFDLEDILFYLFFLTLVVTLSLVQSIYLYKRLKNSKSLWSKTFLSKVVGLFQSAFLNRRVGTQVFLVMLTIFIMGMLLGLSFMDEDFLVLFFPVVFVVGIPLFIIIVKRIGSFNRIFNYAQSIAKGELEQDLKIKGKGVLAKLAQALDDMKQGVKTSQSSQAKSERLKTELITNVSHDLRTPLTSIITYTELLKDTQLGEDERNSYIEIIDRKSKRLKVLIDDLFEASKMASGNIELSKTRVDIVQLLHQSLAEHNESAQDSPIQFRLSAPDHPVYAVVDGQKLWRVFENLIANMRKYSLENTRAYINVKTEDERIILTFKNISKYELSENADELFERFKRGDESRHTEGSGLGLAIAKSIIDLHGAQMDIDVDGDLFKVTVVLKQFK
jgi:signal transduction histidine kinase